MPLLDTSWGFEPWYLEQLGELSKEAETLIDEQRHAITMLGEMSSQREALRQYYNALGVRSDIGVKSMAELKEWLAKNPNETNVGVPAAGSVPGEAAANAVTVLSAKTFDNGTTWRYAMQESA